MTQTTTNIKNLPADRDYYTEIGYSQTYPWVVIKETAKTKTLAKVEVKKDPDWKPEILPGGFAGHCTNQGQQTWIFDRINEDHTQIIRKTKKGWSFRSVRFVEGARYFYDYNF